MGRNPKYDVWCKECGCLMKLRKGKYGDFWGCTGFPLCRNTMRVQDGALQAIVWEQEERDAND